MTREPKTNEIMQSAEKSIQNALKSLSDIGDSSFNQGVAAAIVNMITSPATLDSFSEHPARLVAVMQGAAQIIETMFLKSGPTHAYNVQRLYTDSNLSERLAEAGGLYGFVVSGLNKLQEYRADDPCIEKDDTVFKMISRRLENNPTCVTLLAKEDKAYAYLEDCITILNDIATKDIHHQLSSKILQTLKNIKDSPASLAAVTKEKKLGEFLGKIQEAMDSCVMDHDGEDTRTDLLSDYNFSITLETISALCTEETYPNYIDGHQKKLINLLGEKPANNLLVGKPIQTSLLDRYLAPLELEKRQAYALQGFDTLCEQRDKAVDDYYRDAWGTLIDGCLYSTLLVQSLPEETLQKSGYLTFDGKTGKALALETKIVENFTANKDDTVKATYYQLVIDRMHALKMEFAVNQASITGITDTKAITAAQKLNADYAVLDGLAQKLAPAEPN